MTLTSKESEINNYIELIRTLGFRLERIKRKGKSRHKSVRLKRTYKAIQIGVQMLYCRDQIRIIQSQPLPPKDRALTLEVIRKEK